MVCTCCGIIGADVRPNWRERPESHYREGRIQEIADYCESDVVNTYRVWLRYELFRGRLTEAVYQAREACLSHFLRARGNTNRIWRS